MTLPISILVAHFVGDFLLQTDKMALNKSKNTLSGVGWLGLHSIVYATAVTVIFAAAFILENLEAVRWWLHFYPEITLRGMVHWFGLFLAVTLLTHFLTDAVTSRITSRLWFFQQNFEDSNEWSYVPGKRHWFFVMIGFDQLIHYITLAWAYGWVMA